VDTAGPPATSARPHRPLARSPKPDDHQRRDGGSGLSHERFRPYRAAGGGDLDLAIGLYEWNSATAGAFF